MHRSTKLVLSALGALLMPHFAVAQEEVEMSVRNRTGESITVYALWDRGTRDRLGDVSPRRTESFTTEWRGEEVTLQVQVQGGTAGAVRTDRNERRSRSGRFIGGDREEDFALVQPGDQLEWDILQVQAADANRQIDAALDLRYRRAGSAFAGVDIPDDVEAQEPRMTNHTGVSQLKIQEAQGTEDDSLRAQLYRSALVDINTGIADDDQNPMAFLHLGIVQSGLKNYGGADAAFDHAEALYPAYFDEEGGTGAYRLNAWLDAYNDALVKLETQDVAGALELFRTANMLYDRRVEAYLQIGVATANTGDSDGSIEAWRRAVAVIESPEGNPGDDATRETWDTDFWIMAQSNLGRLLSSQGNLDEAVAIFETILDRFPDNAEVRSALGSALAQSGQTDGALSVFDAILASETGTPLDYFNAGVSLYSADEMDKAVLAFEKTVARSPMYRDAVQNLAQTLNLMENYEAQVPHSEKLIELDPYNDYAYLMHVRALVQVGREPDGVAALNIMQALPFVIDGLQLQPLATGAHVSGVAVNKALEPGTSITLRFTFYDNDGNPVGTADTEVTVTAPDVAHEFGVTFNGEIQVLGYSYELVS